MPFAFEDTFVGVQANLDVYVDEVFACLKSEFLVMPRGPGFVEYSTFAGGYEALKRATTGFRDVTPETVAPVVFRLPIALIVLRCMLGFTPPEWAYYATQETNVEIPQGAVRDIDRQIRMDPKKPLNLTEDDGTARDKITRIQHLAELAVKDQPADQPKFEVVACIAGRGFKVRREDMKKLLIATRGKVFTLQHLQQLVESTGLQEFRTQ